MEGLQAEQFSFRYIRGNDIAALSHSYRQFRRGKQRIAHSKRTIGQRVSHLNTLAIEAAGSSRQTGVRSNRKAVISVTPCLRYHAAQAFRHIICDGVGHRIVLIGLVLLNAFRPANRQRAEILCRLDDSNRITIARDIRKLQADIAVISLLSCINLCCCAVRHTARFIYRQCQNIDR